MRTYFFFDNIFLGLVYSDDNVVKLVSLLVRTLPVIPSVVSSLVSH